MKHCTITGMEVKTIYNITISDADMGCILDAVLKLRDRSLLSTLNAFEGYDLNTLDSTQATSRQILKELWNVGSKDTRTVQFIIREILGFDGVENYGYYDEDDEVAKMVVYKHGDRLNA